MKTLAAALFILVVAIFGVAATDFPANMPECGKTCGTNMLAQAAELGCQGGDVKCLCEEARFGYGIHDCSVQSCSQVNDANMAINWANNMCANLGVSANIPLVPSGSAPADYTETSGAVTATTDGSDTPTAFTTSTWTSTFTSGSVPTTVTGETTISGVGGVATSSPVATVVSPIVSTETRGSEIFETTVGSTTLTTGFTGADVSSEVSTEDATSTSTGRGAQVTAAPALGVLAAAGIAAALL
ncbi:hypothetical protein VTK26DRAFT_2330 [Humicola hyalothermophila]